jgi:hypothetical protein
MDFFEDAQKIVNYSLTWLKGGYWNLYGIFAAIYFAINLVDSRALAENGGAGAALSILVGLVVLVVYLFLIYFSYKVLYAAMSTKYSKLRKFDLEMVVKLFISNILMMFAALFSAFELKWLSLPAIALVLGIAGFATGGVTSPASIALFALAALLGVAYFIIVIRNFSRLYLQSAFFLQGAGVIESIKQAWLATAGKALKLFGFSLIVGIVAMVITLVEIAPQLLAGLVDASITLAGIPLTPFTAVFAAIFAPATILIQYFAYAAMYEWLLGQKTPARKAAAAPKLVKAKKS